VTSSVAVFEACDTGKINAYDKIAIENRKRTDEKPRNFLIYKSPSKRVDWNSHLAKVS